MARRYLAQLGKNVRTWNRLRFASVKTSDAAHDLRFPSGFRTWLSGTFDADEQPVRQRITLFWRKHERIPRKDIK